MHPSSCLPNVDILHIKRKKYPKPGNILATKLTFVQSIELTQISLVIYVLICVQFYILLSHI